MAACGQAQIENDDDCVQVVRKIKTVNVPCTRNVYQTYTVKVPRQVTEKVPRTVTYTDYEVQTKQVPYTVTRPERRVRMQTEKYQVPVVKYFKKTVMETRERQVPVPYDVNIPETKYRTVTEKFPVQRTKVQMEDVVKTVYDVQTRTRCVPQTKMVTKQIPVYSVIPTPAPPCPPEDDYKTNEDTTAFEQANTNKDGAVSHEEYTNAQATDGMKQNINNE